MKVDETDIALVLVILLVFLCFSRLGSMQRKIDKLLKEDGA